MERSVHGSRKEPAQCQSAFTSLGDASGSHRVSLAGQGPDLTAFVTGEPVWQMRKRAEIGHDQSIRRREHAKPAASLIRALSTTIAAIDAWPARPISRHKFSGTPCACSHRGSARRFGRLFVRHTTVVSKGCRTVPALSIGDTDWRDAVHSERPRRSLRTEAQALDDWLHDACGQHDDNAIVAPNDPAQPTTPTDLYPTLQWQPQCFTSRRIVT